MHKTILTAFLLITTALGACKRSESGAAGPSTSPADRPRIVCTTQMLTDTTRTIAGDAADVSGLMGQGVDPHLYKPSPGDMSRLGAADLVIYNGLHLEGRMADVLEKLATRKPVFAAGSAIDKSMLRTPPQFDGHPDPHIWFDVLLWKTASRSIADFLAKSAPSHAAAIHARADAYAKELDGLDQEIRRAITTIPTNQRVLVTAHDAFGYFGRAYGMEVLGVQGISTDSEAGLADINRLVDVIVERKVPAVFIESSVPRKTIEALIEGAKARGHTVAIGGELFSDAMGREGTPEGTYLGMVRHNIQTIVHGLGGVSSGLTTSNPSGDKP